MSRKKTKEQTIFGSNRKERSKKQTVELSQFCKDYLAKKELFRWFIEKYYGLQKYVDLWDLAKENKENDLRQELNAIWYELPDSTFNLQVRPSGWEAFVNLIEE